MIKIQNDEEFIYVETAFNVNRKANLKTWIKKEVLLTRHWLDLVNLDFEMKKMQTRI